MSSNSNNGAGSGAGTGSSLGKGQAVSTGSSSTTSPGTTISGSNSNSGGASASSGQLHFPSPAATSAISALLASAGNSAPISPQRRDSLSTSGVKNSFLIAPPNVAADSEVGPGSSSGSSNVTGAKSGKKSGSFKSKSSLSGSGSPTEMDRRSDDGSASDPSENSEDLPQNRIRRGNICEAWQSTKSCLKERVSYLFNNDTLSDISFLVGRARIRIPGHKFILAVGSPVFDAMFNGPLAMQENEKTVELPDVEPEAFLALLKFLYTDDVSVSAETVLTVLYTAKKYAVPTLEEHCVAFLKDNLTSENAFLLLSQARLFDEPQLAALCLDCIDKNTAAAFSADGFTEVDLDTLCAVLERDTLRIKEICLFEAALRWASQECVRRGMEITPQNQRYTLGRALHLIRFPLMPVEDFSLEVAQMALLTETELVRLFLNFTISSNNVHLRPKQEFIDRPRCYMTGKQLTVYRFQQVETRWGYNGLNDQIRFTTDRRIYVVGFGMYGGLFGTKEYKVDIQLSHTLQGTVLGHHSDSFCSDGSKSTFKVMFREPIEVLPEVTYTASATLRGPDSHYGAKGQRKVGVECPDGTIVNFTFSYSSDNNNGTSVEDGQIPEIIFHT